MLLALWNAGQFQVLDCHLLKLNTSCSSPYSLICTLPLTALQTDSSQDDVFSAASPFPAIDDDEQEEEEEEKEEDADEDELRNKQCAFERALTILKNKFRRTNL